MEIRERGLNKFYTDDIDFTETHVFASVKTPESEHPKYRAKVVT